MSKFPDLEPRRYLIAIGSSQCPKMEGYAKLTQVEEDVQQVVALFQEQGYTRVLADQIALDETSQTIKQAVGSWFTSSERRPSDHVIIYYGGHGDDGGRFKHHYLLTLESTEQRITSTAIKTKEFVESFFGGGKEHAPQNILLILDTCYAGAGARQSFGSWSDLKDAAPKGSGVWMLSSADAKTEAGDGAFVKALRATLQSNDRKFGQEEFVPIDRLVEKINDLLEQGQTATFNVLEGARGAKFILNPQFVPLQNANQLLLVLEQIEQETLNSVYRSCYPQSLDYPLPTSIESLLRTLLKLSQGVEVRLPKFVSLLLQDKSLTSEKRQALQEWGSLNLLNFEAFPTQVALAQPISTDFYLMVYISENRQFRGRYTVQVCLPEAIFTTSSASSNGDVPLSTTLSTPSDKNLSVTIEEVPEIIAKLVDEVSRKGVAIKNLSIQCFLPRPLLSMPIDQIEIAVDGKNQKIGSLCKTVVVRSTERQTRSATAGNWEERWRNYEGRKNIGCQDALILHEGDLEEFYEALEEDAKVGCCFEGLDDSDDQDVMFDEMFLAGIPIALWLRPGHALPDSRGVLQSLLDGYIEQLPASLTRNRRKDRRDQSAQAKITHHVTLLWDNPFQPFPNDDWTGRSA